MSDELVHTDDVLKEAETLVPDLLVLLEQKTDRAPLVAVAALEMASGAIIRATEHALDYSFEEQDEFRKNAAVVKTLAQFHKRKAP